jgi:hypothetical protein
MKTIPVDRRRHRDRETRLMAISHGLIAAAGIGLKNLEGRRASSKLPELFELVMATVGVGEDGGEDARCDAAGGAADCFGACLRGMTGTGRGRFRA